MAGEFELTLDQLIGQFLPAGFSVSEDFKARSVQLWQLYLWQAFPEVTVATRFVMDSYPENALPLFAALVVHDALSIALTGNFLNSMGAAGATVGAESNGGVKAIKTGPAEVEFHDTIASLAKLIAATKDGGGLLGELQEKACMFASQLGIQLPFCPRRKVVLTMVKGGIKVPNVARAILRKPNP